MLLEPFVVGLDVLCGVRVQHSAPWPLPSLAPALSNFPVGDLHRIHSSPRKCIINSSWWFSLVLFLPEKTIVKSECTFKV